MNVFRNVSGKRQQQQQRTDNADHGNRIRARHRFVVPSPSRFAAKRAYHDWNYRFVNHKLECPGNPRTRFTIYLLANMFTYVALNLDPRGWTSRSKRPAARYCSLSLPLSISLSLYKSSWSNLSKSNLCKRSILDLPFAKKKRNAIIFLSFSWATD